VRKQGRGILLSATQAFYTEAPGFAWLAHVLGVPGFFFSVRGEFAGGRGRLKVKGLGWLLSLAEYAGPEVDQAKLFRHLAETVRFSTIWLTDIINLTGHLAEYQKAAGMLVPMRVEAAWSSFSRGLYLLSRRSQPFFIWSIEANQKLLQGQDWEERRRGAHARSGYRGQLENAQDNR
jgi:Family of unknown function (DUF6920)